ncbi:MAG: hypothetical protein WB524_24285, partial [Acidobacteriaceae bacterium]
MLVSILRERDDATDSGWGLTLVCATGTHQDGHVAMLKVRFSRYGSEDGMTVLLRWLRLFGQVFRFLRGRIVQLVVV